MRWRRGSSKAEILAVCVVVAGCASPGARPLPADAIACVDPRPQVCTMDYDPVCGLRRAAKAQTYGNACGACADPGVVAHRPGACGE